MRLNDPVKPPSWAQRLLRKFASPDTLEEVEGDLEEFYLLWQKTHGPHRAKWKYIFTVLTLLRPFGVRKSKPHSFFSGILLRLHSHFSFALRNLVKNKYYTSINVLGLVFGMLSVLIIAKYIGGSLQMEQFHLKKELLFFITQQEQHHGSQQPERNSTYRGVAEQISQTPEVVDYTRYYQHVESLVLAEQENGKPLSFAENKIFVSDSSFFNLFTFPLIRGNEKTALSAKNSIVITESISRKYFGDADPMGEPLTIRTPWGSEADFQVTGVIKDPARFTRFSFDFLIPETETNPEELWTVPDYSFYVLLKENASPASAGMKLTGLLEKEPELKAADKKVAITLMPLADPSLSVVDSLLLTMAIFIMLISWINYINQIIAQSYWRIKEVGVKRVMGASRTDLKVQFLIESVLTCVMSLMLIMMIYVFIESPLQVLTRNHLLPLFNDPTSINAWLITVFAIGATLAASVPAILLLSPNFGAALKSIYSFKPGNVGLRKGLVVFQFSISTILLISIFVISGQLNYLRTKDKGIDLTGIVVIKSPIAKDTTWMAKRKILKLFKERCEEIPMVVDVSSSTTVPGEEYRHETFLRSENSSDKTMVHQNGVDEHFFSVYNATFLAGHDFTPGAVAQNRSSIILNETAAKAMGITNYATALHTKLTDLIDENESFELIGIVKDFHQTSVKYQVKPMAFKYNVLNGHCSIKVRTSGLYPTEFDEGITRMNKIWNETYPDASFNYFFMEEHFAAQDTEDQYFGTFFLYFTILSVVLSCLGLFGLSLMLSLKRQREIGVRKVFGATSLSILFLFLKEYSLSLILSLLIGVPVAYLLMTKWLTGYAHKIEIGMGMIFLSTISLIIIFLGTVSYHTLKSSMTNPSKVLKE